MADGILGLGSGQATTLNQDLIDKLKDAERKATVEPLETRIDEITRIASEDGETTDGEAMRLAAITQKANELLETIAPFDLYATGDVGAFDQKSANATGTSVVFDAADEASLNTGTTTVFIEQLARRDVYQSNTFDSTAKEANVDLGTISIALAGADGLYSTSYDFDTTGKTYDQLVEEINYKTDITASLEQVGDDSFRLVIKSAETGNSNALQITGDASLGFSDLANHVQEAKNLKAEVNGIQYDVSTNVITVDGGLKITAVEENEIGEFSTISIEKDTTNIATTLEEFAVKYNELVSLIDEELYSADSPMEDKSSLRTVLEGIKDKLFGQYGEENNLSLFNFGFELDRTGLLTVNTETINEAISDNLEDFKSLFLGLAEDEGLGTQLKTYVDSLDGFDGLLTMYEENMNERQESLEEERDNAIEDLDNKYALLAQQFADYGAIITQFESSFNGLSLMIEQSTSSN